MEFYCSLCGTECECEEDLEEFEEEYIEKYFNCKNPKCKTEYVYHYDRLLDKINIKILE